MVVGEGLAVHGAEGLAEEDSGRRKDGQGSRKIEIVRLGLVSF